MLISKILKHIEDFAPLSLALEWDNVGLLLGDPGDDCSKALVTLDVTPNAVRKAIETECNLIVAHHPLIFRPLKQLTDPLLLDLARHRISVICLHTNLDVAPYGVNHALADALGLQVLGSLSSESGNIWYHLSVIVPTAKVEAVAQAAFSDGAGRIGNYTQCSSRHTIEGTFRPGAGSHPFIQAPDSNGLSRMDETELEFMLDKACLPNVLLAIRHSHPYETPSLYYFPVANPNPAYGLGLICHYEQPKSLEEIAGIVSANLHCPHQTLWTAGLSPETEVERIAICGGAGASVLKDAQRSADLLISGDIGYHHLLESPIPIIDAGHFYTEYPVLGFLQSKLASLGIACEVLSMQEHEYFQRYLQMGEECS